MLIEDEWPSTNVVESVEKDGDCRFVSFDSTDVEIQVLRRHMMDASTDLTIPQTPLIVLILYDGIRIKLVRQINISLQTRSFDL
jgi:hypothetical protein